MFTAPLAQFVRGELLNPNTIFSLARWPGPHSQRGQSLSTPPQGKEGKGKRGELRKQAGATLPSSGKKLYCIFRMVSRDSDIKLYEFSCLNSYKHPGQDGDFLRKSYLKSLHHQANKLREDKRDFSMTLQNHVSLLHVPKQAPDMAIDPKYLCQRFSGRTDLCYVCHQCVVISRCDCSLTGQKQ